MWLFGQKNGIDGIRKQKALCLELLPLELVLPFK